MAADPSTAAAPGKPSLPRRFWLYWAASVVSWMGDGMLVIGFPLLAAAITHSALLVALTVFMQRLPMFLFSIPIGAIVDRWNARRTAVAVNVVEGLLLGGAGTLIYYGHYPLAALLATAFAMSVCEAVFTCADGALMGDIVKPELFGLAGTRLMAANSIVAYVAGPALGGLLFSHGRQIPILIDAASFVLAAGMLLTLRLSGHERELPPPEKRHFVREVRDGLKLVFGQAAMRLNATVLGLLAGFQAGSVAVYVLLGTRQLGLSQSAFGVATAAGNLVAPFFLILLPRIADKKTSRTVVAAIALMSVGELLMGTATTAAQMSIGLAMDGTAVAVASTSLRAARMRLVPRETLGRMTGAVQTMTVGAGCLGTLVGGAVAHFSLRGPYIMCAVATLVLLVVAGPRLKTMDVPPETAAGTETAAVPAQSTGEAGFGAGDGTDGAGEGGGADRASAVSTENRG
jgi:MFS family permease